MAVGHEEGDLCHGGKGPREERDRGRPHGGPRSEERGVMADGVHLDKKALDYLLKKAEEHFVSKKRGPTERSGPDGKRSRIASEGGRTAGGGRGGRGGRGGGGWRNRFFSQY